MDTNKPGTCSSLTCPIQLWFKPYLLPLSSLALVILAMDYCHKCHDHVQLELCVPERAAPGPKSRLDIGVFPRYRCPSCQHSWYQCGMTCHFQKRNGRVTGRFSRMDNLKKHLLRYHVDVTPVIRPCSTEEPMDDVFGVFDPDDNDFSGLASPPCPELATPVLDDSSPTPNTIEEFNGDTDTPPRELVAPDTPLPVPQRFQSESLNDYLTTCTSFGYYHASKLLVCRAAHQRNPPPDDKVGSPWLICFLNIARIVMLTTSEVHELLSGVLIILMAIIRFFLDMTNMHPSIPMPETISDFQSMITNGTNTNSLKSILPIPHFEHNTETEHSFASPTELVPMTMFLPPNTCITEGVCERYRSTVKSSLFFKKRNKVPGAYLNCETPCVLVFISLWSDGWDPNRSNKSNRHPVWTATGTMIFVELGDTDNPYLAHTVLLGVGPGKESHEEFFDMLVHEKENKWEGRDGKLIPFSFFSKHHGKEVNTFITMSLAVQDNPERRDCSDLLAGNSNTHGIFGVSCDFSRLAIPLEACQRCQQRLYDYVEKADFSKDCIDLDCPDCLGWSIDKLCSHGKYKETVSGDSISLDPTDEGYKFLREACRIQFEDCIRGWNNAIQNFIHDQKWDATKTKAYLKLFCCNTDLQKRFIEEARLYMNIRNSLREDAHTIFEPDELEYYRSLSLTSKYRLPKHPAIWSLFTVADITETPMHLTMGAIKALLSCLLKYTACRDRQQDFIRRCNEALRTVQDLRVDLAPVLKFKDDKFGGFVAENYSAMAMLVPWLSHILEEDELQPTETCVVPEASVKPVDQWNGKECKAWLAERGIKGTSKLNATQAKEMVMDYHTRGNSPDIVEKPGRDMAHEVVRTLLFFANSLFATIMLTDLEGYEARNRAMALVGLFLSKFDFVDQKLFPGRTESIWVTKYNMLGLLRVPEHFLRHRHFRNQYEGGTSGEGLVKELRKMCPNAVRSGWSRNMMLKFYRNISLDGLCDEVRSAWMNFKLFDKPAITRPYMTSGDLKKFRRYRDRQDVEASLQYGYPLSVIAYNPFYGDELMFACVMSTRNQEWCILFVDICPGPVHQDSRGYLYFPVALRPSTVNVSVESSLLVPGYKFNSFAIMLPELWNHETGSTSYRYAFISEDWQKMNAQRLWSTLF